MKPLHIYFNTVLPAIFLFVFVCLACGRTSRYADTSKEDQMDQDAEGIKVNTIQPEDGSVTSGSTGSDPLPEGSEFTAEDRGKCRYFKTDGSFDLWSDDTWNSIVEPYPGQVGEKLPYNATTDFPTGFDGSHPVKVNNASAKTYYPIYDKFQKDTVTNRYTAFVVKVGRSIGSDLRLIVPYIESLPEDNGAGVLQEQAFTLTEFAFSVTLCDKAGSCVLQMHKCGDKCDSTSNPLDISNYSFDPAVCISQ